MRPRYPSRPRRPKRDPILMGEPSPSLSAIRKLNMEGLEERIARLGEEISRLEQKIGRLKAMHVPPPPAKIDDLAKAVERLQVLRQAAIDRLAEKTERKRRWDQQHPEQGRR